MHDKNIFAEYNLHFNSLDIFRYFLKFCHLCLLCGLPWKGLKFVIDSIYHIMWDIWRIQEKPQIPAVLMIV